MKKIVAMVMFVSALFLLPGVNAFGEEPEVREVFDPVIYDDGSNFEPVSAELDSAANERAPEAMPEDEAPTVDGLEIE